MLALNFGVFLYFFNLENGNVLLNIIYIIKERLETLCAMESYLPISDRHAASWIFSDGPRQ